MEGVNFSSPNAAVRTQQSQLTARGNQQRYSGDSCLWNYQRFYHTGLHTAASCNELGACKFCQPLQSYSTSLSPMYVGPAEQQKTPKSHQLSVEPAAHRPTTVTASTTGTTPGATLSTRLPESNRYIYTNTVKQQSTAPVLLPTELRLKSPTMSTKHECCIPGCGKAYERLSHLKAHMRWHGNPAPFKCRSATCGKRFSSEEKLDLHMKCHK